MTEPMIRELTDEECWKDLHYGPIGRLAVSVGGEPDIFPVTFAVHERALYFRTAPGTKLLELTVNERVALEVDSFTDLEARSVVVKGLAERLERQAEIDAADEQVALVPWMPTLKYRWVRITPTFVRGICFERKIEPGRY